MQALGATLMLAALALPAGAQAQTYPSRPVRMVVPFSPGGAADVPARILAQKLSDVLGQQFVVDNRPGAGSTIGADVVAKATPDGYTLLCITNTHFVSASLYRKLPYHPLKDFAPISESGHAPNVLVVNPSLPAKSVAELIALAKASPGKIDYASSGNGSSQHLFGALFMSMAHIEMTHVPYKGSGPATTDLIAGQVKVSFPGIAIVLPHVKSGRLRALGVTSAKRATALPDVPSIAEAGLKGYDATLWLGVAAPQGTPRPVIGKLHEAIVKALKAPDLHQ
ncbi:MAG TPA: tripartite tricarboxylate transporter substrate binding protein, partial [Burkholderiales bacterium]|nr:tripartite tricarboxylate transporter substrate binding protein [Burkholderiales bacterium]